MFTGLFRILAEHELSVPPEIAGAFRALATIEGTLTQLAPGFDILAEARRFTTDQLAEQLSPEAPRKSATDELISLVPMLRRLPASPGPHWRLPRARSTRHQRPAASRRRGPALPRSHTSSSSRSWQPPSA